MDKEELMEIVGYVKVSKYRAKTLRFIGEGYKMPSEIAKELDIATSQASNILKSLKNHNLVVCINPNVRKGRLYQNTELGFIILEKLD